MGERIRPRVGVGTRFGIAAEQPQPAADRMIQTNTRRTGGRRVRIRGGKLSQHGDWVFRAVRQRKCVQQLLDGGGRTLSGLTRGHTDDAELWQREMEPFVGQKEERTASEDRPAQDSTDIMLVERRLLQTFPVHKPVVGVERVVAEVVEQAAAKPIGSRTCDDLHLRARHPTEIGGICRRLNREFLDRVQRSQVVGASEHIEGRNRTAPGFTEIAEVREADVGAHPVHREIVCIVSLAVGAELPVAGGGCDARNESDKRLERPAVERQVVHQPCRDRGADRGGIQSNRRHASFDRDCLRDGRRFENEIQPGALAGFKDDSRLHDPPERWSVRSH